APVGEVDGGGGDVDAESDHAAFCQREHVTAGPAADVEHRRNGAGKNHLVLRRRGGQPAIGRHGERAAVGRLEVGGHDVASTASSRANDGSIGPNVAANTPVGAV